VVEQIVKGTLLVDGQPSQDQELLLISADMNKLLAVSASGPDGSFEFAFPAPQKDSNAIVLAKLRRDFAGVVHRQVDLLQAAPLEIEVETKTDSFNLEVMIESSVGYPEHLDVFLDPIIVAGVPEQLTRYFKQVDRGIFTSHFLERLIDDRAFDVRVMAGTYKIGGHYIIEDRPMLVNPTSENFIGSSATVEPYASPLEGDPDGGFALTVDNDCRVVFTLRVLEDKELVR